VSEKDRSARQPTQADVARLAGVSQTAVSHVLNEKDDGIPAETRQRILQAIEQLSYVPNLSARSLRTRKTYTIASVIPDITNPFYPTFQRGIQDVARSHEYDLILYNTDGLADIEARCLRSLVQGRVDGVVVVLFNLGLDALEPLLNRGIAVVALVAAGTEPVLPLLDTIYVDNVRAAETATNFLISRGHTHIGMIAGVKDTPPRQRRIEGYRRALNEHHLPLDEFLIRGADFTEQGGYEAMQALLQVSPRPTAVFAANDLMAIGAFMATREAGLNVPNDVAVVGFDDIPAASMVNPPLTTIAHFQRSMGEKAAQLLFDRLNNRVPETGRSVEMPYKLIVRGSA